MIEYRIKNIETNKFYVHSSDHHGDYRDAAVWYSERDAVRRYSLLLRKIALNIKYVEVDEKSVKKVSPKQPKAFKQANAWRIIKYKVEQDDEISILNNESAMRFFVEGLDPRDIVTIRDRLK